jgi:hypothetical protein
LFWKTGSIDLTTSGGTSPYTYVWTKMKLFSARLPDINGLSAGVYAVTVSDSKSCSATRTFTITSPATALALAASTKTDASCFEPVLFWVTVL